MPRIYLCFLWHMHQPFYKDLISGNYHLPWTRLHALKDYYGMVRLLDEFPRIRQTFNLVPSMMVQVQEYAEGKAADPFLEYALKPAETLTADEQAFILQHFFNAYPSRMIYRYARYGELYEAWNAAHRDPQVASRALGTQGFRDLQVLSQIAWFDEEFLANDPEVIGLVEKGRNFSREDQLLMGRKQQQILNLVLPAYKRLAASGQIEISTTPFYHPILPLLCDSSIASVSHPNLPLPTRFRYPQDARVQLERARQFVSEQFGTAPVGLWPSEGSVSDETFHIASEIGFEWTASDSGVLARTLGRSIGADSIYRPYEWRQKGRKISVLFRDHLLSDLIGFVYSRMHAQDAADDFLNRVRENCMGVFAAGRDALIPIILDGENAWEYYDHNGRPFLRALYQRISEDPQLAAITVRDALQRIKPEPLDHIFPGSWINANFDVWIGAEEDNEAWEQLLRAREAYDRAIRAPQENRKLAYEELLIAEGSDWCWWYGPEHESVNRVEFDQLYRDHLANVYGALDLDPPEELSRPILKTAEREFHFQPSSPIRPAVDGEVTSYFEWLGAGLYRIDARSGSIHGQRHVAREVHYGTDASNLFLRVDFADNEIVAGGELHIQAGDMLVRLGLESESVRIISIQPETPTNAVEVAFKNILEARISLAAIKATAEQPVRFQLSFWRDGLPFDAVPQQGWIEAPIAEPAEWTV